MLEVLKSILMLIIAISLVVLMLCKGMTRDYETDKKVTVCIRGMIIITLSVVLFFIGAMIPRSAHFNIVHQSEEKVPIYFLISEKNSGESFTGEIVNGKRVWIPYKEYKVQVDTEIQNTSPVIYETSSDSVEFKWSTVALFNATVEMDLHKNPGIYLILSGTFGVIIGAAYISVTLSRIRVVKAALESMGKPRR